MSLNTSLQATKAELNSLKLCENVMEFSEKYGGGSDKGLEKIWKADIV